MTTILPDAAPSNWVDRHAPEPLRPWLDGVRPVELDDDDDELDEDELDDEWGKDGSAGSGAPQGAITVAEDQLVTVTIALAGGAFFGAPDHFRIGMGVRYSDQNWKRQLNQLIQIWNEEMVFSSWNKVSSLTPIQPVILGSNANALAVAKLLDKAGYWIPAIRPPTVPPGSSRLRITFSANHSIDDLRELIKTLQLIEQEIKNNS